MGYINQETTLRTNA